MGENVSGTNMKRTASAVSKGSVSGQQIEAEAPAIEVTGDDAGTSKTSIPKSNQTVEGSKTSLSKKNSEGSKASLTKKKSAGSKASLTKKKAGGSKASINKKSKNNPS